MTRVRTPVPGRRPTVLLVDDSTVLLNELGAAFEAAGYEVGHAVDGEEVFRKFTAFQPDAMLLDVYMPKINGADVCRRIKAHPVWSKTFRVLMSARMSEQDIQRFKAMGADEFLRKPFSAETAVGTVSEGLKARAD